MENILHKVLRSLKATSSEEFFHTLTTNFLEVLDVDYIFVAKLHKEKKISRTISLASKVGILENFEYPLQDTPCAEVVADSVCCYPNAIQSLFPKDQLLIDLDIEAYVGSPLHDSKGNILGLVVALSKKEIVNSDDMILLFDLFSTRIAGEIERNEQEKRLQLFSNAMQSGKNPMLICDASNSIVEVNQAFENVFEYSKKELIGQNPHKVSGKINDKTLYQGMWKSLFSKGTWSGEFENKSATGKVLPMHTTITTLYNTDGHLENYLAVYNDLTKIKQQEVQLRQQAKMASMGEMLGSITHQWKQPISVIQAVFATCELQEDLGTQRVDDYKKMMYEVKQQIKHMMQTMNDFQSFLRPDKCKESFSLHKKAEEVIALFNKQYKQNNLSFSFDVKQEINVVGYSNEYKQVVVNIINNARDAYIENNLSNREIVLGFYEETSFGCIKIQDCAGGIDQKIIKDIFSPYVSTKSSDKGTGIGLYMAKNIIENMQGYLEVSSVDMSTTFTIKLPLNT